MEGIGAMLHYLRGGSIKDPKDYYGNTITKISLENDILRITFGNGISIKLWDNGQSCCERRYITCDDDLQSLVGNTLTKIEAKEHITTMESGEPHEIVFIEISTNNTSITLCTHNEHNGSYGGFGLSVDEIKED